MKIYVILTNKEFVVIVSFLNLIKNLFIFTFGITFVWNVDMKSYLR